MESHNQRTSSISSLYYLESKHSRAQLTHHHTPNNATRHSQIHPFFRWECTHTVELLQTNEKIVISYLIGLGILHDSKKKKKKINNRTARYFMPFEIFCAFLSIHCIPASLSHRDHRHHYHYHYHIIVIPNRTVMLAI